MCSPLFGLQTGTNKPRNEYSGSNYTWKHHRVSTWLQPVQREVIVALGLRAAAAVGRSQCGVTVYIHLTDAMREHLKHVNRANATMWLSCALVYWKLYFYSRTVNSIVQFFDSHNIVLDTWLQKYYKITNWAGERDEKRASVHMQTLSGSEEVSTRVLFISASSGVSCVL